MVEYEEELLEEIEEIIDVDKEKRSNYSLPISFDGNQFSIKISKSMIQQAGLKKGDTLEFSVKSRYEEDGKHAEIICHMTKHEKADTTQE